MADVNKSTLPFTVAYTEDHCLIAVAVTILYERNHANSELAYQPHKISGRI